MYYTNKFEWSVLLNFYAAWVKLIEKGENTWGDDTSEFILFLLF
jgi:hypothetical protein